MRYIQRGNEPIELTQFKAAENDDWTATYDDLTRVEKNAIRKQMAEEQGYLCGYCGVRILDVEGDCHIEHVEAQSTKRERELDYSNMLGSCMGRDVKDKKRRVPEHCGESRGNRDLRVTPFMQDCEESFVFGNDGRIEAAEDPAKQVAANDTIEKLQLNVKRLRGARAAAIEAALQGLENASTEEMRIEAERYEKTSPVDGKLDPFAFAIRQVLLSYA
jgi:uncharacterized protein (TIGR02646 family)